MPLFSGDSPTGHYVHGIADKSIKRDVVEVSETSSLCPSVSPGPFDDFRQLDEVARTNVTNWTIPAMVRRARFTPRLLGQPTAVPALANPPLLTLFAVVALQPAIGSGLPLVG